MTQETQNLAELLRNSPFAKSHGKQSFRLVDTFKTLGLMLAETEKESDLVEQGHFERYVPDFQRTNDKWSEEMQVAFIENLMKGFSTTLTCYNLGGLQHYILDGLQRITAIKAFLLGDLKAFGLTYQELVEKYGRGIFKHSSVTILFYSFESEAEAVNFYIDLNKNIAHSQEDVDKAEKYLQQLQ